MKKNPVKKVVRIKYEDGGEFTDGDPGKTKAVAQRAITPVAAPQPATAPPTNGVALLKKRLTPVELRKKYSSNPYVKGRETWGADLDTIIPASDQTARQAVEAAAKATGVNPALLYSSASEEGLNLALHRPGDASEAYVNWSDKNPKLGDQFPVDGFYNYGLDTFGNNYPTLVKKGYLPQGFEKRFTTFDVSNEKNQEYKSAAFASDEDALIAKAALIKDAQDAVSQYEKQTGTKLSARQKDFFALAGYNGGNGIIPKMAQSYAQKGYLKDDKFLDPTFKPTSYAGVYTNVQRRLQNKTILENEGYFKDGGSMKGEYEDGGPFKETGSKIANDPWAIIENQTPPPIPTKIDPMTVLPVDQAQGTAVNQGEIKPIDQFYDIVNSEFGNKKLQDRSASSLANAEKWGGIQKGIETAATFAITGVNKVLGEGNAQAAEAKIKRQQLEQQSRANNVNPYLQGNGSQAIFEKGGSFKPTNQASGVQILGGGKAKIASTSDHSNPMFEFLGKEHKDGGIGIAFNGGIAEVEHKEMGWVDDAGTLQLFGKLKVPGTNQTFRKVAKDIATEEKKVDDRKGLYLNILNNAKETDPYSESALSTAKVMFKSLDKQSKEIAEKKEAISSYQNLILDLKGQAEGEQREFGGPMFAKGGSFSGSLGPDDPIIQAQLKSDFSKNGRDLKKVKSVILHKTAGDGNAKGVVEGWNNDKRKASADYIIDKDGTITQVGDLKDTKWGSGRKDVNETAFNVEIVGKSANESDMTDAQFKALARLHKDVFSSYGISANDYFGHTQVNKKKGFDFANADSIKNVLNKSGISKDYTPNIAKYSTETQNMKKVTNSFAADDPSLPGKISTKNLSSAGASQLLTSSEQASFSPTYKFKRDENPGIDTPFGKAMAEATPNLNSPDINNSSRVRGKLSPLDLSQIAPELLSLATNVQEPVNQTLYQPDLKQTFDISYQLGRNENQATFNQASKIAEATGNIDALSQLAAQKYNADQQYNNQEIQGNAQQKLQTYSQNVDTLNDAKLKNLQLLTNQTDKQAAAKFNTRKETIGAFSSIEGKVLQNNLENRQYNAYANLFKNYGFDKNGNVTFDAGKVTKLFSEGERQQFGMLAAQKGIDSVMGKGDNNSKTITTTDGSGNVKKITNIDSDLEEFNTIMGSKNLDETQKRSILSKRKNSIFQDIN